MSENNTLEEMDPLWDSLYETAEDVSETLDTEITVPYDASEDPEDYVNAVEDLLSTVEEAYKRRDQIDRTMAKELDNRLDSLADDVDSVVRQARLGQQAAEDLNEVYNQLDDMELTDRTRELIEVNDDIYEVGQDHGVFADNSE
jgi:phage gp29-like protein